MEPRLNPKRYRQNPRPYSRQAQRTLQSFLGKIIGKRLGRHGLGAAVSAAIIALLVYLIPQPASQKAERTVRDFKTESVQSSGLPVRRGEQILGKVVKVSDGDTVTLLVSENKQIKIRLLGIDAPEKSQPFGETCRENLARLIAGKDIKVEVAQNDRYGRVLGRIEVDGTDTNLAQIQDGCAWHYKQFASNQRPQDRQLYADQEIMAKSQKKGLWRDPQPTPPWQYRQETKRNNQNKKR